VFGVFITILIISIVILITNLGIGMSEKSATKIGKINAGLEKQLMSQYEDATVTGNDVALAVNLYWEDLEWRIFIIKKSGSSYTATTMSYTYIQIQIEEDNIKRIYSVPEPTSNTIPVTSVGIWNTDHLINLVNKRAMYKSYVILTTNGSPCGLAFVEI